MVAAAVGTAWVAAALGVWLVGSHTRPPSVGGEAPRQDLGFHQLLPRDAIRPVYSPRFTTAADAPLQPDELVIGVKLQGVARAYPIEVLNLREMVNDRIGPVPFLVTW